MECNTNMIGPITDLGTYTPQENKYTYKYDPSSGGFQVYEFDSFNADNAIALANANIRNRVPTEYSFEFGRAKVVLQDSNFPGIDTYQILANESSKSRYDAPAMLRILKYGNGTDFYTNQIAVLKNGISAQASFATVSGQIDASITGTDFTYLSNVYNLLLKGSESYPFSQYVLRHETEVGNGYSSNVADFNVDCVYTVGQLLSELTNSSSWIYPLPPRFQYFVQYLAAPATQPGYLWGWLKRSGTNATAANNRDKICTEYWLDQWEQTQLGSF